MRVLKRRNNWRETDRQTDREREKEKEIATITDKVLIIQAITKQIRIYTTNPTNAKTHTNTTHRLTCDLSITPRKTRLLLP